MPTENISTLHATARAAWRQWLQENHENEQNIWLIIYRKQSGTPSVYYDEAVDEALCFGWIDSAIRKRDEVSYLQYFAKRNPKSNWSKVNKEKIARLTAEGLMMPAGAAMVALAKQSGTWTALDEVENLVIPAEMAELLDANPAAKSNFEAFPRSAKRGILEWINTAKQPETKTKRIQETVRQAALNERANFPKKK